MPGRRRRPLTARGVCTLLLAAVLAIAANVLSAPILLYVAVLLLLLVIIATVVVHAPRRSGSVARQVSTDLLTVGEPSPITVRFALRSLRTPSGVWRELLPPALDGDAAGPYPPPGPLIRYSLTGTRRGVWPLGPLILRTTDPFALAQREQAFGDTHTVTVVPAIVPLSALTTRWDAAGRTARTSSSRLGQGSDNLSPRHYVPGDSMRRIHWRATAHRGELMVRQEEEESSPDAVVVLDRAADRWARTEPGEDTAFETAVSACASIALHLGNDGYGVDIIDSAGSLLGALRRHEEDRAGLLITLASIAPRGGAIELATAVGSTPPGPLVVITGRLDAERALPHGGAGIAVLLAADPKAGALAAASRTGWHTGALTEDIAACWEDALPERRGAGSVHVPH